MPPADDRPHAREALELRDALVQAADPDHDVVELRARRKKCRERHGCRCII
jgi:hypothetical protein